PLPALRFHFSAPRALPLLHSFPTRRSSDLQAKDLFISQSALTGESEPVEKAGAPVGREGAALPVTEVGCLAFQGSTVISGSARVDRKSTRLNSSHVSISYAVFCLKKKREHR